MRVDGDGFCLGGLGMVEWFGWVDGMRLEVRLRMRVRGRGKRVDGVVFRFF